MLFRNEIYLEGYGCPFGVIYFCHDLDPIGFIKISLFCMMVSLWIMTNSISERIIIPFYVVFVIDQIWNFLILYDCFFFIHYPKDYQGISWTPSKSLQQAVDSEKAISKQDSFFMLCGYFMYILLVIPFLYLFLLDTLLKRLNRKKEENEHFRLAEPLV